MQREGDGGEDRLFTPSPLPASEQILDLLRAEPADTVTIVALGPLTNLATAAAADPAAFLRVKEVRAMGGALAVPGNVRLFHLTPFPSTLSSPPYSPAYPHPRVLCPQPNQKIQYRPSPAHNPTMPCPPVSLIWAPPSPLRAALMSRNQITPVAGKSLLHLSIPPCAAPRLTPSPKAGAGAQNSTSSPTASPPRASSR
jgi:hypothetical protein